MDWHTKADNGKKKHMHTVGSVLDCKIKHNFKASFLYYTHNSSHIEQQKSMYRTKKKHSSQNRDTHA